MCIHHMGRVTQRLTTPFTASTRTETFDYVVCATGRFDPKRVVIPDWAKQQKAALFLFEENVNF